MVHTDPVWQYTGGWRSSIQWFQPNRIRTCVCCLELVMPTSWLIVTCWLTHYHYFKHLMMYEMVPNIVLHKTVNACTVKECRIRDASVNLKFVKRYTSFFPYTLVCLIFYLRNLIAHTGLYIFVLYVLGVVISWEFLLGGVVATPYTL